MDQTALPDCRRERIASVRSFVEKCSKCTKTEPFGKGTVTQESRKFFIYRCHLTPNFDVSKNRGANIKKRLTVVSLVFAEPTTKCRACSRSGSTCATCCSTRPPLCSSHACALLWPDFSRTLPVQRASSSRRILSTRRRWVQHTSLFKLRVKPILPEQEHLAKGNSAVVFEPYFYA